VSCDVIWSVLRRSGEGLPGYESESERETDGGEGESGEESDDSSESLD
jgi:hypothetical protein